MSQIILLDTYQPMAPINVKHIASFVVAFDFGGSTREVLALEAGMGW